MEITIEQIKDFARHKHTFTKGETLWRKQSIIACNLDEHSQVDTIFVNATIKDEETYYEVNMSLNKEDGIVMAHHCHCQVHKEKATCPHCCAVLWKLKDEFLKLHVEKQTTITVDDTQIQPLLNYYETALYQQMIRYQFHQQIEIEPVMEIRQKQLLAITLKIGKGKQYIIKNIAQFLENITNQAETTYGKEYTILHAYDHFTPFSKTIIDFLYRHEHDTQYFLNSTKYQKAVQARNLCLQKDALDEWFQLFENQDILFRPKEKTLVNMKFLKQNPPFLLTIHKHPQGYETTLNMQGYLLFYGREHLYVYYQYVLYQCDQAFTKHCTYFLQQQEKSFIVPQPLMIRFYQNVILSILPYIPIEGEDLSTYAPSPLQSQIYLDLPKPNMISAKLLYTYQNESFPAFTQSTPSLQRNYQQELQVACNLLRYTTSIDQTNGIAYITSADAMFTFLHEGFEELSKNATLFVTDKLRRIQIKKHHDLSMGIRIESDLLEIQLQSPDFPIQELQEILQAYHLHKKFYRMKNGSFLHLEDENIQELSTLFHNLKLSDYQIQNDTIQIPKYHALHLEHNLQDSTNISVTRDTTFQDMIQHIQTSTQNEYPIPPSLQPILRNYQVMGYRWLKTMTAYGFGGILADDMGIGKTLQIIALLEDERIHHPTHTSLVVCPSSLLLNWKSEIEKFTKDLTCLVISGNAQERKHYLTQSYSHHVLITSYDYIKRDISLYEDLQFTYFILDEAQYIKNHTTKNAVAVKQIQSKYKFALTGTPIENTLSELWSVFDFLMPNYLFPYSYFKKEFEYPIVKEQDSYAISQLQKMVKPFMLRRVKKDVLTELPDKTEKTIFVELDEETKKLYAANIASMRSDLQQQLTKQGHTTNKIMILSMLTRLRQLCCDPRLLFENYHECGSKIRACMEFITSCHTAGKKVLLFSQFTSVFTLLKEELEKQQISYYILKGSTPKQERLAMVNAFNTDDTTLFLISLKAGGTGLNLTGAEVVIHFDPWWNVSAQNQATDRAYRMGQHHHVMVVKFVTKHTIEEKIMLLQEKKQGLADAIIQQNEGIITNMSKDEILDLF